MLNVETNLFNQGLLLHVNGKSGGVCEEICKQWVSAHVSGTYQFALTLSRMTSAQNFRGLYKAHNRHQGRLDSGRKKDIRGLDRRNLRKQGTDTDLVTRNRDSALAQIASTPGAYIYRMMSKNFSENAGHSFAFSSLTPGTVYFIDPNIGEFAITNYDVPSLIAWFKSITTQTALVNRFNIQSVNYDRMIPNAKWYLDVYT